MPEANREPGVILGYPSDRSIAERGLSIGEGHRIRSGAVIYEGTQIGRNLQTGHNVVIREENELGDDVCVWSNSVIDYGCKIGHRVRIHANVYIAQYTTIGDDAFLAPGVATANDRFPMQNAGLIGPTIGEGARIGANSTLMPGIRVGAWSVIGAGSVVTKDVPAGRLWYGNPARDHGAVQRLRDDQGHPVYDAEGRRIRPT